MITTTMAAGPLQSTWKQTRQLRSTKEWQRQANAVDANNDIKILQRLPLGHHSNDNNGNVITLVGRRCNKSGRRRTRQELEYISTLISKSRQWSNNCFKVSVEGGLRKVAHEFGGQSPCDGGNKASSSKGTGWAVSIVLFLPSFLNDKKTTSWMNEMCIRTWCYWKKTPFGVICAYRTII